MTWCQRSEAEKLSGRGIPAAKPSRAGRDLSTLPLARRKRGQPSQAQRGQLQPGAFADLRRAAWAWRCPASSWTWGALAPLLGASPPGFADTVCFFNQIGKEATGT